MAKRRETKRRRLRVERVADVPLREVSGICLRRGRNRKMSLVAIGDHAAHLAWTSLPSKTNRKLDWHVVDLTRISGSKLPKRDPQIEAVCADGGGRVLLFREAPPRAELVDLDASQVVASVILRLEGRSQLARSWLSQGFAGPDNPFPWMSEAMDLKRRRTSLKHGSSNIRMAVR